MIGKALSTFTYLLAAGFLAGIFATIFIVSTLALDLPAESAVGQPKILEIIVRDIITQVAGKNVLQVAHAQSTVSLTINTQYSTGQPLSGMWTVLR